MADRPDGAPDPVAGATDPTPADGVDLARTLLAQARADARARGQQGGGAPRARQRRAAAASRSGAHPDDRDPQLLRLAVRRLVAEHGWEDDVAVGAVMGRWAEIVGAHLADHCTPEHWADGVLTVRTDSTAWATQVRLLAPDLLRRLAAELGPAVVTRVDVVGPRGPSWVRGARSVRGRGPRDTYG